MTTDRRNVRPGKVHAVSHAALEALMGRAELVALRGVRGSNPLVGAVIVDEHGEVVAEGHHAGAGTAHAEVMALSRLPARLWGKASSLTLVVTLEPCRLQGRTGPCVEAIVRSGVGRVVYAAPDPTSNGGGGAALEAAGVDVIAAARPSSGQRLNRRWLRARQEGRPFVTAHLAQTLDGYVADAQGHGRWVTSTASRDHAHGVRSRVQAIVVGTGTVRTDNPSLTVRVPGRPVTTPRVVVAGSSPLPAASVLAQRRLGGGDVRCVPGRELRAVLDAAASGHVLVEGGPTLLAAFIEADLVDELYLYLAPTMLGGGVRSTTATNPRQIVRPWRWEHDQAGNEATRLGDDVLLHLTPSP